MLEILLLSFKSKEVITTIRILGCLMCWGWDVGLLDDYLVIT
ncbi:hypothetical protein [Candidatus Hodgkinia cicadicola]